jgi:hypothetical protein
MGMIDPVLSGIEDQRILCKAPFVYVPVQLQQHCEARSRKDSVGGI